MSCATCKAYLQQRSDRARCCFLLCSVFDAYVADEAFITSTSWAVCGIRTINGRTIGDSTPELPHGPVTRAIMDAYKELVDFDFEDQYLNPPAQQ